jgi:nitroimidazol reductase NimA-like FMN-containing flavoprotein (pyridoxamine 5'-phosphate oxidase superfamily)
MEDKTMLAAMTAFPIPDSPQDLPLFRTLPLPECADVLTRNSVGRIAFSQNDDVSIVPIHYVYADGWIYGRTASAGRLRDLVGNRRIAFEVDEHAEPIQCRSVVVHGPLYIIRTDSTERRRSIYRTALSVIRRMIPSAPSESEPIPFRDQLFRIRAEEITGRGSLPARGRRLFAKGPDKGSN